MQGCTGEHLVSIVVEDPVYSPVPVYIAVGREVQFGLDRSRGGHSSVHQVRKL